MDITKNIFSKAYDGLFGPSSPITNEPTIDYNHTIPNFNTSYSLKSPSHKNPSPRFGSGFDDNRFAIQDDDSDDELNNDMNMIYNQFTDTNTRLSNSYHDMLPQNYPGSFNVANDNGPNLASNPKRRPFSSPNYDTASLNPNDKFYGQNSGYNLFADEPTGPSSRFRSQSSRSPKYDIRTPQYDVPSRTSQYDIPKYESSRYDIPSKYETKNPSNYDLPKYDVPKYDTPRYKKPYDTSKYNNDLTTRYNNISTSRPGASASSKYNDTISRFNRNLGGTEPSYNKPNHPTSGNYDGKLAALNSKINRYTNKDNTGFDIYKDPVSRDDTVNKQIQQLEKEINRESLTKINTKFNKDNIDINLQQLKQLNQLNNKVTSNNDFLQELNSLVDINNDPSIKIKEFEKYNELRQDYVRELHNYQDFYLNYLKLFQKYKSIKGSKNPNVDNNKIITKLNLIKESTNEQSVKLICNNLLNELK